MVKQKMKAPVDKNGRIYFWKNDTDGLSQQDFIVILMSAVLFGGIGIGLVVVIVGMFLGFELSATYIQLIRVLDIPFATVVAGIFTVKTASAIVNRKSDDDMKDEKIYTNIENDENNGGY
ncbi:hypothetical protein P9B03_12005 [Metasolibacillus meyeri]|uniref:Uncharacterized protein n=1 Tax=Metasolibacillus meyeri TaxID=1071052 RepID=A0AAW9NTE8_9BACL|nr:hypothetical protein [Metasolibacillus meyeri]MEC1179210.1 hypothetical protein [Metasolibacillus meyeri]